MTDKNAFRQCAKLISEADGLLITAGAGMGVDSGLPDFRGREGFWRAYPALAKSSIDFESIASPSAFVADPTLAWGFYGHRLNLYRNTVPHDGFKILRAIADKLPGGAFVFTSNVDGQFQRAGFGEHQVHECHGSIHWMQCQANCSPDIWRADNFQPRVDENTCRLLSPLPRCRVCGTTCRPNILMFNDWHWLDERNEKQRLYKDCWLSGVQRPVVIELGAGTSIPTVRKFGERQDGPLIRINLRESHLPAKVCGVALGMGALVALQGIESALVELGWAK